MMIFTYLKIGVAVVVLAVAGYFVWNYQHMAGKITKLQEQIAGLELRAEIIEKAQKATDEFMKTKGKLVRRNVQQKAQIDTVVEAGNDNSMRQLFINSGLLKPAKAGSSTDRSKSRPGNIPGRPPGILAPNR